MREFDGAFSTVLEWKSVKHLAPASGFFVSRKLTVAQRSPRHFSRNYENGGMPAEASMLMNVPGFVTARCTEAPDLSVPEQGVAFGASGHRGSSFEKVSKEWHT